MKSNFNHRNAGYTFNSHLQKLPLHRSIKQAKRTKFQTSSSQKIRVAM
jgi:hypothetical protein